MKILLTSLSLLLSISLYGQKPVKFEVLNSMPRGALSFASTQGENDIYVLGGSTNTQKYSKGLQIYDIRLNQWMDFSPRNLPGQKSSSVIYVDELDGLLLAGGITESGTSAVLIDEIRIIDRDQLKVQVIGKLPNPASDLGLAKSNGMVYMFGGSTRRRSSPNGIVKYDFSDKFYALELANGFIYELPDLPKPMVTSGGIVDGSLYLFGGFDGRALTSVWQYQLREKVWKELKPLQRRVSGYALAQYKDYFILVGDYTNGNQLILYNAKTGDTEYFRTNFCGTHMGASVIGDDLYVYGGRSTTPEPRIQSGHFRISMSKLISNSK